MYKSHTPIRGVLLNRPFSGALVSKKLFCHSIGPDDLIQGLKQLVKNNFRDPGRLRLPPKQVRLESMSRQEPRPPELANKGGSSS